MKLPSLTIGKRVALGFALLVTLGASVGGFVSWEMKKAATDADFVARAVAPQAEIISSLAQSSSMAQRAIRGYSLIGGAAELAEARNYITVTEAALQAARKLSDAQPRLTLLIEKIGAAETTFGNFLQQVEATVTNVENLGKIRIELDAAATQFLNEINAYISQQDKTFAAEIAAGSTPENLLARRQNIERANKIIDDVNAIRVINFKAQALRQPELLQQELPRFAAIENPVKSWSLRPSRS